MRLGGRGGGGRYGDFEVASNMKRVHKFLKKKILFKKTKRPANVIMLICIEKLTNVFLRIQDQ